MQYIEFKEKLKDFTVFSLADIRAINTRFHRRRLSEWQDKGYIIKIIKGYYVFSDKQLKEDVLFEIANRIYNPSYISFEMALSYYNLIPEAAYGITSASTRRTYAFKAKIAEFTYRTLSPRLFFGYNLVNYDNKSFKVATPEKAILDYFYINPKIKSNDDYAQLRINRDIFKELMHKVRLHSFLKKFAQKSLSMRISSFCRFIRYDK